MSIILMLNEKFRENVPPWEGLMKRAEAMPGFFQRVLTLKQGRKLQQHEKVGALHSPHAAEEVLQGVFSPGAVAGAALRSDIVFAATAREDIALQ